MTEIRIDELARRAGLTVDTIRFYQREGLLPPAARAGRAKVYGQDHLDPPGPDPGPPGPPVLARGDQGPARVRAARARRRHLLRRGLDLLLPRRPGRAQRRLRRPRRPPPRRRAAPGPRRVRARHLRRHRPRRAARRGRARAPRSPRRRARRARVASTCRASRRCSSEVLELFSGHRGPSWDPEELRTFQQHAAASAGQLLPLVTRIVDYVHQRTLQRLTLGAIERDQQPGLSAPGAAASGPDRNSRRPRARLPGTDDRAGHGGGQWACVGRATVGGSRRDCGGDRRRSAGTMPAAAAAPPDPTPAPPPRRRSTATAAARADS